MSADWTSVDRGFGLAITACGVVQCFFGHRLLKLSVGLSCFFGTFALAQIVCRLFDLTQGVTIAAGLACGAVSVWAVHRVYRAGVFCIGAAAGFVLTHILTGFKQGLPLWLIFGGVPLISGGLALALEGTVLALSTSVAGGGLIAVGLHLLRVGTSDLKQLTVVEIGVACALAGFGFYKQKK